MSVSWLIPEFGDEEYGAGKRTCLANWIAHIISKEGNFYLAPNCIIQEVTLLPCSEVHLPLTGEMGFN